MNAVASKQLPSNYWWLVLLRGIVAILFGIAALAWPGPTLTFFIYLFAGFAVIDGIIAAVTALQERQAHPNWWLRLVGGIVGIILGLVVFFWPAETLLILFYLIAAWAIVTGIMTVISAFSRYRAGQEWTLVVSGVLSILLGLIMAAHPIPTILLVVWLIGVFAIVYGIVQLVRAFQFRSALRT